MTQESKKNLSSDKQKDRVSLTITRPELLVDGSDSKFRELVHGLIALSARHQQIRAGHAKLIDLSPPGYTVLIAAAHLAENKKEILIRDIAEHLKVTPTYVSVATNSLSSAGLMKKERNRKDSRVAAIKITKQGWKLLEELAPNQSKVNDLQFADLTKEEFDKLHELVFKMVENSDNAIELQRHMLALNSRK